MSPTISEDLTSISSKGLPTPTVEYQELATPTKSPSVIDPESGAIQSVRKLDCYNYAHQQDETSSESRDDEECRMSLLTPLTTISSVGDSNSNPDVFITPPHLSFSQRNGKDLVRQELIDESDTGRGRPFEELDADLINGDVYIDVDRGRADKEPVAARSAIRGQEDLPVEAIRRQLNLVSTPSEATDVTDLGTWLYDLKSQGSKYKSSRRGEFHNPDESLQDQLLSALQQTPSHAEKKEFFPMEQLADLVYEDCVTEQLRRDFEDQLDDDTIRKYAQKICGIGSTGNDEGKPALFKKIFVILVLAEKTRTIPKFLADEVTDDDLPLHKVPRRNKRATIFDLGRRGDPDVPLQCFKNWTSVAIRRFEALQWQTLAPFFARGERKNVKHYILQDQVILPFMEDSQEERESLKIDDYAMLEFEGGYSQVFQVNIHPEHHDFHDSNLCDRSFAIKCLLSRDKEAFKQEVYMLKKFSADSHPHLVSLLATFEQFGKFYLVFHWADADLQDYWEKKNPDPPFNYDTILWVANQCEGIAGGLLKVHRYESNPKQDPETSSQVECFSNQNTQHLTVGHSSALPQSMTPLFGRHGDIKPANVLWFRDLGKSRKRGILKLADFGLAEFNPAHSKSYKPRSKVATTANYRPPECDLRDGVIGLSYDIWTLGCMYLEFIAWLLGGYRLVEEFTRNRTSFDSALYMNTDTFFEIDQAAQIATIKPSVVEFFSQLHSHENCTEFLHEFLQLIQTEMIVVKPRHSGRINCGELHQRLLDMVKLCGLDTAYASYPAPWKRTG